MSTVPPRLAQGQYSGASGMTAPKPPEQLKKPRVEPRLWAWVADAAATGKAIPKNLAIAHELGCDQWTVQQHLCRWHDEGRIVIENEGRWVRRIVMGPNP